MQRLLLALSLTLAAVCEGRPLLVLSVDGLDHRYLRDADKLGLKIPNLRRLMREGILADGVVGVVPTVTWPSHTTIISGVPPHVHGILSNRRPKEEGGDYYWSASLLKAPTLVDAARKQGMKTAAITWPVTVDAPVDFNLPEAFSKRNGGEMDLKTIEAKGTPGLVDAITREYPSFPKEWMDDRARTQATMYLVRFPKPDFILVHFVDHDAEAHHHGPFGREAKALVEYTDELIGDILRVLPKDYALAVVSDHGFERTDEVVAVQGEELTVTPFLLIARSEAAAVRTRELAKHTRGIGREVPAGEVAKLAPQLGQAVAAWEPLPHFAFGNKPGSSPERGNHGLWPTRADYRSVYLLWGNGIKAAQSPEMQMTDMAAKFADVLGLKWPPR